MSRPPPADDDEDQLELDLDEGISWEDWFASLPRTPYSEETPDTEAAPDME